MSLPPVECPLFETIYHGRFGHATGGSAPKRGQDAHVLQFPDAIWRPSRGQEFSASGLEIHPFVNNNSRSSQIRASLIVRTGAHHGYTMIGVYDTYARAEAALDELLSRGFARHKLHLGPMEDTPVGREAELRLLEQSDGQTMNRLTLAGFFRTLSGQQDNHGDI